MLLAFFVEPYNLDKTYLVETQNKATDGLQWETQNLATDDLPCETQYQEVHLKDYGKFSRRAHQMLLGWRPLDVA